MRFFFVSLISVCLISGCGGDHESPKTPKKFDDAKKIDDIKKN